MATKTTNYFTELDRVDVTKHIKKKGKFNYLSWAYAVRELKTKHPTATWTIHEYGENCTPFVKTECGFFVEVWVDVDGVSLSQVHPVLDNRNQPIEKPNAFHINTSLQRGLAKCIALHGLGLYIFAGEDLPEPDALTPKEEENLYDFAKPLGKKFVNDLKNKVFSMEVNANNYEDCMNKIEEMCHELKSAKGE